MSELTLDQKFSLLLESLGTIDKRLETIEKNILDMKLAQVKHDEILQNQTQIIELLSSRSINQEAEIKMIKAAI